MTMGRPPRGAAHRRGRSSSIRWWWRPSGAVAADELLLVRELAAVVHQEAAHASELVQLLGLDLDGQLLVRQVGAGELEGLACLSLVLVDLPGVLVVPTSLELLEPVLVLLFLGLARCVVIGCHSSLLLPSPSVVP